MFGFLREGEMAIFTVARKTNRLFLCLTASGAKKKKLPGGRGISRKKEKRDTAEAESMSGEHVEKIPFPEEARIGDVWTLGIPYERCLGKSYYLEDSEGRAFSDPYGRAVEGDAVFGQLPAILPRRMKAEEGSWAGIFPSDRPLELPYSALFIYRTSVRGFSMDSSSKLKREFRGTFRGITENISYLTELSVTALELLPVYDYQELMMHKSQKRPGQEPVLEADGRVNFWGFTDDANYLALKRSFSGTGNPEREFAEMVRALHQAGIELYLDFYVSEKTCRELLITALRHYHRSFHVDGFRFVGIFDPAPVMQDPYLSHCRFFYESFPEEQTVRRMSSGIPESHFCNDNNFFQNEMRKLLKGDEGMIPSLMQLLKLPGSRPEVRYLADLSGFSLMDVFSYDRKHNEANGEQNRDGTDQNYSWNCGEEGVSRKKEVRRLRKRLYQNAILLLFLQQDIPMLAMGDEYGHTRHGNNNAYCQDGPLNYLHYRRTAQEEENYCFTKEIIRLRKEHPVFRRRGIVLGQASPGGIPEISFHGEDAWRPGFEPFRRQLAVLYSGETLGDDSFLLLCNFHWESHYFHLPLPPEGKQWKLLIDTGREKENGIVSEELLLPREVARGAYGEREERGYELKPRSMQLLTAVEKPEKTEKAAPEIKKGRKQEGKQYGAGNRGRKAALRKRSKG